MTAKALSIGARSINLAERLPGAGQQRFNGLGSLSLGLGDLGDCLLVEILGTQYRLIALGQPGQGAGDPFGSLAFGRRLGRGVGSRVLFGQRQALSGIPAPAAQVIAVRPTDLKKGASVQVIAARPDGSVEPLLWIYQYNPAYQRTYYYKKSINLPAGTEIQTSPPDAGKIALFATAQKKAAKTGTGLR